MMITFVEIRPGVTYVEDEEQSFSVPMAVYTFVAEMMEKHGLPWENLGDWLAIYFQLEAIPVIVKVELEHLMATGFDGFDE